ncbi:MAG: NAD(P)-dependent oxidoreductase [Chitinophagaceae bacterium]|nr:NAD(P)-dependent oxidoreductase [Chitinophagaceae bacterium]MBK7679359.1 NAD(P)-dependent oxidoreductase [Chitinophagaceae bacterium]MBK8299299.1 NAD(P)-dependent oxidoreductase [Chitinophagaceae bacterium]MBK9659522.1 NAD(P)-dependent oxidoreductase [Chitinophagaceae bacterium]MBL0068501.1 NAD(P)-dependent oxidoreductase [Chitinophagaceae bacterium]
MAITNNKLSQEQYEQNFADIHPPYESITAAKVDANRCLFCYDAPCMKSCPTSIDVPKFIKQIATENIKGSAKTILSSNIMGAGCSKVCPVEKLCEGACVYNLLEEEPIPIAKLQRYSTEQAMKNNWKLFERKNSPSGVRGKVAIVGAGPAGLSCAHSLSKEGVDVTIYEKESKGGGLMTYGIAAYKVTPQFCEDEVNYILSIGGIEVNYNQELGKDISLAELKKNYDAVYLGIGVGVARQLEIPGEKLDGVADAISFIYDLRSKGYSSIPVGDKVAVIGMGMTAIDAATQAKRLGAKEVTMVYRRTEAEKPCTQHELDIAMLDGCEIIWLATPKKLKGSQGKVKQLVCSKMKLGEPDASGRRSPVDTGETFTLDVDMVIKAAGQVPFEKLVKKYKLDNKNGKLTIDKNCATNIKGVFAGGDAVNGGKEVVDAVQAGKDGALAILKYLNLSQA